jgi:DHA2 family multidrug resistance protein-like MFS transporter
MLGRGVGLNALVVSIAAALGPTIASGILAVAPWEWLFAVNVPIGLFNLILAARALPASDKTQLAFDVVSAGLNAVLFGLLFIGIDTVVRAGSESLVGPVEIAIAVGAGTLLLRRTVHASAPIIPIDLMRTPLFSLSVATSVCSFTAYMLAFLAMPFFLETVMHRDQVQTGLLMTPWPVALGLAASVAGRLADKLSTAILGTAGLIVLAVGLVALATLTPQASSVGICWRMALCGLGFGFFQAPNNRTLLASAPRSRAGAAGGMLAVARLFGMTLGATVATIIFRLHAEDAETIDLVVAGCCALAAAALSLSRLNMSVSDARGQG